MFRSFRGGSTKGSKSIITGGITMPISEVRKTLEGYTEAERDKILGNLATLALTAQFMGSDFRMKVLLNRPGEGWSWNFKYNEVLVDPETILKAPLYVSKATYCHEGFHRRITPGGIIPESDLQKLGYLFLVNVIEDCRIENFGAEAYPSYRGLRDKSYKYWQKKMEDVWNKSVVKGPHHTTAGLELIRHWHREELGLPMKFNPNTGPLARRFVLEHLSECEKIWWHYPSHYEVTAQPWKIEKYFERCLSTINSKIWPEFEKLIEIDRQDELQNQAVKKAREHHRQGTTKAGDPAPTPGPDAATTLLNDKEVTDLVKYARGGRWLKTTADDVAGKPVDVRELSDKTRELIQQYIDSLPQSEVEELQKQADTDLQEKNRAANQMTEGRDAESSLAVNEKEGPLEGLLKWLRRKLDSAENKLDSSSEQEGDFPALALGDDTNGADDNARPTFIDEKALKDIQDTFTQLVVKSRGHYFDVLSKYADTVNALENELRRIFEERRIAKRDSGLRSGPRLNVNKFISERAAGRHPIETRAFERRQLPSEKDYAVTVMVDQSGSMWRNEKRDRAFEAAVVVTEVLSRLGIEHSILGYTETQRTYKEFAEELDVEKLERMPLEGGTDNYDGAAVDYACGLLQQQEEDRKILIVISDGAPNDNLKAVTDRVQASGAVRLIGLGIGPDTSCVTQYYKHSRADIPVQDLPQALSEAVREAIEDVT